MPEQIAPILELSPAAGWVTLVAALWVALILTAEHYTLGRREMSMTLAIRHGVGLLTILAGVWLWAVIVRWIFPALMFTLMILVGSAFMALWYLLDCRVEQARQMRKPEVASMGMEGWAGEVETLPRNGDHDIQLLPAPHVDRWQELKAQYAVDSALALLDSRQGAREIRIRPDEEIVVEDGRIVVREVKAHQHLSAD